MVDVLKVVRESPHLVGIYLRGKLYRWRQCAVCQHKFWKNTTDKTLRAQQHNSVYCSKVCQREGYRVLNNARQKRWRDRRRDGLSDTRTAPP